MMWPFQATGDESPDWYVIVFWAAIWSVVAGLRGLARVFRRNKDS